MKWYRIRCPQCKWEAQMVDENVAGEFHAQQYCWDCQHANRKPSRFEITEIITNTRPVT